MERRSFLSGSHSLYALSEFDKQMCGFLNRKTMTEPSGKRSKDRTWQTFWCQAKDGNMEFYKVQGVHVKGNFEPPPRDIYPPPNRQQHKVGFAVLEGAWVEVDITSQKNKDLDKRRKFLFQVILTNDVEYLFQAPSENQMFQWVAQLKRAAITGDEGTFDMGDKSRIKTSRCSLNKRSKHNTNSVRATIADPIVMEEDVVDFPGALLRDLDPRLPLLRRRLQSKRELLRQLQKMLSSFHGDLEPLFRESEGGTSRRTQHRGSNVSLPGGGEKEGNYRRSGTSESISSDGGRVLTTLVRDYYLLPGVAWTVLKEGEPVEVIGRMSNGWYRCKAQRDAKFRLDTIPTLDEATQQKMDDTEKTEDPYVLGHIEEDEKEKDPGNNSFPSLNFVPPELLEPPHVNGHDINGITEEEDLPEREQDEEEVEVSEDEEDREEEGTNEPDSIDLSSVGEILPGEEEGYEEEYNAEDEAEEEPAKESVPETFFRKRTSSYMQATLVNPVVKMRPLSLGRKDSYYLATSKGSMDMMDEKQTRHLSYYSSAPTPNELKKLRISTLIEHERANEMYIFPLVGAIPPSVLHAFANGDTMPTRLVSTTSDYSSITPATDDSSSVLTHMSTSDVSTIAETPSSAMGLKELSEGSIAQDNHMSLARSEPRAIESPIDIEMVHSSPTHQEEKMFSGSYTVDSSFTSLPESLKGPIMTPPATRKAARHLRSSSLPSTHPAVVRSRDGTKSVSQATSPDIPLSENEDDEAMTHEVRSPSRNGTLRIIPSPSSSANQSPTHSEERRKSNGDATKNSSHTGKDSHSIEKPRHSLDDGKSSRGLLHRFKNVLAKKSHINPSGLKAVHIPSPSPSPTPITPPRARAVMRLQEEENHASMMRSRVSSISGRAVHSKGMGVVFGESSSGSDSEEGPVRRRSSEGGSGGTPPSSIESSPVIKRRLNVNVGSLPKSPSPDPFHHGVIIKTMSTPLDTFRAKHEGRIGSDSAVDDDRRTRRLALGIPGEKNHRRSSLIETNITRYIKAPPREVKRSVRVIPENNKYGFHLEGYEVQIDDSKFPRTIVRHIVPGSPAFVAGLYPGDCILEVNGKDTHNSSVLDVVTLVQESTSQYGRVDLVVAFVDGVNRLDLWRKSEEVRTGLRQRQNKLDQLIKQEREQCPTPSLSPTPSPTHILSRTLSLWSEATPTLGETMPSHYPYSSRLNSLLAIHHGDVSTLLCDLLVIPMRGSANGHNGSTEGVSKLLRAGGRELMDELSLADQCGLGKNLFTDGYSLTVQAICHCVFGQSEDHLISCCRRALEEAFKQDYKTILIWLGAFIEAGASPLAILETVRCWLEEGEHSGLIDMIIFSMPHSEDLLELVETCFPLTEKTTDYQVRGAGDSVLSSSSIATPLQTNGIPSSYESTAIDSPESESAHPMSQECSSSKKNLSKDNITEPSTSSSSVVTSVSDPNVSIAWETDPGKDEAGGVQEKLSELEALLANISHLTSPKHHQ